MLPTFKNFKKLLKRFKNFQISQKKKNVKKAQKTKKRVLHGNMNCFEKTKIIIAFSTLALTGAKVIPTASAESSGATVVVGSGVLIFTCFVLVVVLVVVVVVLVVVDEVVEESHDSSHNSWSHSSLSVIS